MKANTTEVTRRSELRGRAEKRIRQSNRAAKAIPENNLLKLIHELEVHQVELEMQTEELRRSQLQLEDSRKKYFDLYDLAPIGYVTLDRKGLIREINLTAAELLGTERRRLNGAVFVRFVAPSCRDDFHKFFRRLFASNKREQCELRLTTARKCVWTCYFPASPSVTTRVSRPSVKLRSRISRSANEPRNESDWLLSVKRRRFLPMKSPIL